MTSDTVGPTDLATRILPTTIPYRKHLVAPLQVVIEIVPLWALFLVLDRVLRGLAQLDASSYEHSWLLPELGRSLVGHPLQLLVVSVVVYASRRHLGRGWEDLEHGRELRIIVAVVTFLAAWPLSTYEVNLYFGNPHTADRLVLLAVAVAVLWRPIFMLPALLMMHVMMKQVDYPLGIYPWTEMNLLFRVIALALAAVFIRWITQRAQFQNFCFVLVCLIAAQYFNSGYGKISTNWIAHRHVNLFIFDSYSKGWARFLSADSVGSIVDAVAFANTPIMVAGLVGEVGALVALWRLTLLKFFLLAWIGLHTGIFLYSGFFFWKWIALELTLLLVLFWRKDSVKPAIFSTHFFLLSLVLIGGGRYWADPPNLTWFDQPISYSYEFEAVGVSGHVYDLPPSSFSLYSDTFVLAVFNGLTDAPTLAGDYALNLDRIRQDGLMEKSSTAEILALEERHGASRLDPDFAARVDDFLKAYLGNWNERGSRRSPLSVVPTMPHLWTWGRGNTYDNQEKISAARVYQAVYFYDDGQIELVRRTLIREVVVP